MNDQNLRDTPAVDTVRQNMVSAFPGLCSWWLCHRWCITCGIWSLITKRTGVSKQCSSMAAILDSCLAAQLEGRPASMGVWFLIQAALQFGHPAQQSRVCAA